MSTIPKQGDGEIKQELTFMKHLIVMLTMSDDYNCVTQGMQLPKKKARKENLFKKMEVESIVLVFNQHEDQGPRSSY